MVRNFYGSEHGKGEGKIGILNKGIDRDILGRQTVINNARELHRFREDSILTDTRTFKVVNVGEINRQRPHTEVRTMAGSRKLHQVRKAPGLYEPDVRGLPCFCQA